jgi:SAM-dependent methyltransferase
VPWIIQATLSDAGIPDGALPSAALLDVLEHLPDDVAALKELHRGLAPGARLYLTVPSLAALWSRFDESAGHFRRYTPLGLRRVVQTAGFEVEWLTGFFTFLTVPIWALRATRERFETPREARCGVGDHRPDATFRALLGVLGAAELAAVRSGWQLPGGASCLAVARKP